MPNLEPYYQLEVPEAGCDEAGRGCLAGPVVAASVILPLDFHHPLLDDSKKLSERSRDTLREVIEKEALSWKVEFVSHEEIDQINILNASIVGMQRAALRLEKRPGLLLVDGNRFHAFEIPHQTFIKGDGRFRSIAAASVLAKTHRDEFMMRIHEAYPQYGWNSNKGYPSPIHRKAVMELGLSPYHRRSFQLKEAQLSLSFG